MTSVRSTWVWWAGGFMNKIKPLNMSFGTAQGGVQTRKKKHLLKQKKTESVEWFNPPAKLRLRIWTSFTCHQTASTPPRWQPSDLEFRASSDEDLIGLKSSLEVEISVSNLPLYDFVGEEKKMCHFEMNFSFKVCWS